MTDPTKIPDETAVIQTNGGAYTGGNVTAGGDVIGRDQVYGDKVEGDKIAGNKNVFILQNSDNLPLQDISQARDAYLQWLIDRNEYLDPRGTYPAQHQFDLKLDEIYISLRAHIKEKPDNADRRLQQSEWDELEAWLVQSDLPAEEQEDHLDALDFEQQRRRVESADVDQKNQEDDRLQRSPQPTPPIPLAQATAQHERLVILGDPGCGKTTLLRYLALQHALANQISEPYVHLDSNGSDGSAKSNQQLALFPILIRVAEYAENDVWKATSLSDFLPQYLQRNECKDKGIDGLFESELAQGGCLVLLDGLDEIVAADDRRGIVARIENFVRSYAKGFREINRFIITSRIAGYRSAPVSSVSGELFAHYVVEEMNDNQIECFLARWCRAVAEAQKPDGSQTTNPAVIAQQEADSLLAAIGASPGARRLAGNPLMLRTLALIYSEKTMLSKKRVELYKLAADTLAHTWRIAQGISESVLLKERNLTPLLGQLAYWIHVHKPTGIATREEIDEQLGAAFAKRQRIDWDPDDPDLGVLDEIDNFLLIVREHTGLFVERAPNRYGFMHLTFEEYYTARHLVADSWERAKLIRQHLHDPRWEEPILLALGFLGLDYRLETGRLFEAAILAQGKEAEAAGLRPSQYEELLGRDYLFALRCLGDQIPANRSTIDELITRLADELLHWNGLARFQAYRTQLEEWLSLLAGSPAGGKLAPLLLQGLNDDDYDVRDSAVRSLGELGEASSEVITALIAALNDDVDYVRDSAAKSLGELGETSSEVITAKFKDESRLARSYASRSLIKWDKVSSEAIAALIAKFEDNYFDMYSSAARSLAKLDECRDEVVTTLISALKDYDSDMRSRAAGSLEELNEARNEVITALIRVIHDPTYAHRNIIGRTDQDYAYDALWKSVVG